MEVKCPYCCKDGLDPTGLPKQFCLTKMQESWHLKRDHQYYYQVQAQLNVWGIQKGVFVVWNEKGIVVVEILRDEQFFAETASSVKVFFTIGVLPEIVGKWLTRKPVQDELGTVKVLEPLGKQEVTDGEENQPWCYCEKPAYGEMVMCMNKTCTIKRFHAECLLIRVP